MTFWSGERLRQNLSSIIDDPNPDQIDCAAYRLRVGPEVYITPHVEIADPSSVTKKALSENQAFAIPAGQFAFLLTEEIVTIPHNKIGFISIRAGSKFRGLANVSGFHVDPGYQGRLIFSVHNVGPTPMQLQRGEQLFLLWVADLDDSAKIEDAKNGAPRLEISTKLINSVAGEIHSLQSLATMVRKTERELSDKINEVDKKTSGRVYLLGMLGTLLVALVIFLLRGPIADEIGRLSVRASGQASEATVDGAGESPTSSQQE